MSIDNSDLRQKVLIRRRLCSAIPVGKVLDAYSGTGEMARGAWFDREVVRIDKKSAKGIDHVGDNLAIAPGLAASGAFSIFDLDAYGNPWRLFCAIAEAVPAGAYGFAITDGIRRSLVSRTGNRWIQRRVGIPTTVPVNMLPFYEEIVGNILATCGMQVLAVEWLAQHKAGLSVRYFGVLAEKPAATDKVAAGHDNQEE